MFGTVLAMGLGVPLAALAWRLLSSGLGAGDFAIRRRGGGRVEVRGRIAASKVASIREFCERHLAEAGPFSVRGTWGTGRVLQLRWSGHLTPSERQRARNFLAELLR